MASTEHSPKAPKQEPKTPGKVAKMTRVPVKVSRMAQLHNTLEMAYVLAVAIGSLTASFRYVSSFPSCKYLSVGEEERHLSQKRKAGVELGRKWMWIE